MIECANCGAPGIGPEAVRLDLDLRTAPPQHVCLKCKRMPRCSSCTKARNRVDLDGVCCPCLRAAARREKARRLTKCVSCPARVDVLAINEQGECKDCGLTRLYREHPITRSA